METNLKPKSVRRQLFECREILRDTNRRNRALQTKLEESERQVGELREQLTKQRNHFREQLRDAKKADALQAKLDTAMGLLHEVVTSGRDNWQADAYAFIEKLGINTTSTEGKDEYCGDHCTAFDQIEDFTEGKDHGR